MLILISPAKTLDFKTKPLVQSTDEPVFVNEANYLVSLLQQYHLNELGHLLSLSKTLAQLNFERYHNWKNITTEIKKPAIFAYKGDVYQGLNADEWDLPTLEFAQKHLRIISGLYGYLRPLDLIKPYRLDMGTPLKSETSADLYDFWRGRITGQVIDDMALMNSDLIVNLASFEYSRSVDFGRLGARVVTPCFLDEKGGKYKVISFYAKRARGLMARYICAHRIVEEESLFGFEGEGYHYSGVLSAFGSPVFTR